MSSTVFSGTVLTGSCTSLNPSKSQMLSGAEILVRTFETETSGAGSTRFSMN
jgi:hypothetical protein